MSLSIGTSIAEAQATYQPSNRTPIADTTLGTTVLGNNNNFAITGGITKGQNTFHSFQDFSVPTSGVATFANTLGNQSIITRVTGGLFSDINGTINTQGANFLLINPNGVVFGPGTQLNVGRVFAASTANGIDLTDGTGKTLNFGTNTAGDGALLSIDPKVIFNVSRLNLGGGNGEINNFGTLRLNNPGQYIGLVGGNVSIDGGRIISQFGSRVELGGLSAPGSVGVGIEGTNLRLSYPQNITQANVSLKNNAVINTVGTAGADISIKAKNIEVLNGSSIANGIRLGSGAAGDVKLQATENINISGAGTLVANGVVLGGKGGNIIVDADSITVQDKAAIGASTNGKGSVGNIIVTAKNAVSIQGNSNIGSFVNSGAEGNGGDVNIIANSVSLQDNSRVAAFLAGKGNNGNVTIAAKDAVSLTNSGVFNLIDATGVGNGGSIKINAHELSLAQGNILTFTSGKGDLGDIVLTAKNIVSTLPQITSPKPSVISSTVNTGGFGQGGNINIIADVLSLDRIFLFTSTTGNGSAGNISATVKDATNIVGKSLISSTVDDGGIGNGGNITIKSGSLLVDNSTFFMRTNGQGSSGNISITTEDQTILTGKSDLFSTVGVSGVGNSGNVNIDSKSLLLDNSSSIYISTSGTGDAGNINILTKQDTSLTKKSNLSSSANIGSIGKSGDINIKSDSLSIQDSSVTSVNRSQGSAGNINLDVTGKISLAEKTLISTAIETNGNGKSGNVSIETGAITADNSTISTATFGQGNAGNVRLMVRDALTFNDSSVFSDVSAGSVGKGGNIDVISNSLSLTNGSRLLSITRQASETQPAGRGDTGSINVKVAENAEFIGSKNRQASGLFASTDPGTEGSGGNINLEAKTLFFLEGAGLASSIAGQGSAGNITVAAKDNIIFDSTAGILSRVEASGVGKGGDIVVSGNSISFERGAGLSSETLGQGNAGNIKLNAVNSIFISGEANVDRNIAVVDRGGIFTRSQSPKGAAGDITITAPSINLDNKGSINAQSNFGTGGNITIGSKNATDLFFLRKGSQVATDAGVIAQQGGDGGNININSNFIFAVPQENSDISANAAQGRGGNVNINSQGLFGIQQRFQPSSNSDITASSSFGQNGIVNINTPGIDPGKDTSELPSTPTDTSKQITQTCNYSQINNKFYVTGRGGHPATSEDSLTQEVVWLDPRNPRTSLVTSQTPTPPTPSPAVGWAFNGKGKVTLLAASSNGKVSRANVVCPTSSH